MNKKTIAVFFIAILTGVTVLQGNIGSWFKNLGNDITKAANTVASGVTSAANTVADGVTTAANAVADTATTAWEKTRDGVNDVFKKIEDGWNLKRKIGENLRSGATMLAGAPQQFKTGLQQLEKMPAQLDTGTNQVVKAIKEITDTLATVQKQRNEIKGRNLAGMGLQTLNDALMSALGNLESALIKLVNYAPNNSCNPATCPSPDTNSHNMFNVRLAFGSRPSGPPCNKGALCNLKNTISSNKQFVIDKLKVINEQIDELQKKINASDISGRSLPSRMNDLAKVLSV